MTDNVYPRSTASADPELAGETATKVRTLVYSRVVGYLTPVQNWNTGKAAEFADRKTFDAEKAHIGKRQMRRAERDGK